MLGRSLAGVAAATVGLFVSAATADVDPIVRKVSIYRTWLMDTPRPSRISPPLTCPGLEILLQDQWNRIVRSPQARPDPTDGKELTARSILTALCEVSHINVSSSALGVERHTHVPVDEREDYADASLENFLGNGSTDTTTTENQYTDPLADVERCEKDIPNLIQLRTNTIRVYAINPERDHTRCMEMLQDAGIYVVSDLSAPGSSINRQDPQWNAELYARYTAVVDEMAKFSNLLGFLGGNEVTNDVNNTQAAPYVKAAVRDMKAYIKRKDYRPIGVGYATSDGDKIRSDLADYFNCGTVEDGVDFWGYNIYSWCGSDSSYKTSGYEDRTEEFSDYSVPAFFAEYGCNDPKPRVFDDVPALYGPEMSRVWSGGIIYMYFQEDNDYGLVSVEGDGSVSKLEDFEALSSQIAKATPTGVNSASYSPTNTKLRACPTTGPSWNASSELPPTPNQELCSCMMQSISCGPKPGLSDEETGELFGQVCGASEEACTGIAHDGSKGVYGAYSMCNSTEQLAWVLNAYYNESRASNRDRACDWDGQAQERNPGTLSGSCNELLGQAGDSGDGQVTSAPTATGAASPGAAATTTAAAGAITVPTFGLGLLQLGAYVGVALLTGAGMILL
ncbi:MAG: 1,3-beta-glucanosyltransferase gas1 [Sclerophora amabilis]|nr:MAG: 1,3-beta-glucanosyltransferase gas1 [Sclerophora amabilis]